MKRLLGTTNETSLPEATNQTVLPERAKETVFVGENEIALAGVVRASVCSKISVVFKFVESIKFVS